MRLGSYRRVLSFPGLTSFLVIALLVRIPVSASGMIITLYVVEDLGRGYGAAGALVTAITLGAGLGSPLLGRVIDRRGLRFVLALTTVGEGLLWFVAPALPFASLLVFAAVVSTLRLPIYSIARQCVTALVPQEWRRQALSVDSMCVEIAFMIGPPVAVVLVTQFSGRVALISVGTLMVCANLALLVANPPIGAGHGADDPDAGRGADDPGRSHWLGAALVVQMFLGAAATLALSGTDVSLVAALRQAGQTGWIGLVTIVWCLASLVGGFLFGMVRRRVPAAALILGLGACTIPIGLAATWQPLCLAVIPAGLLCAPSLTASTDVITRLAPRHRLGEVLGWHGTATTAGVSLGAPLAGWVIDQSGPEWGFAAVGMCGCVIALVALAWPRVDRCGGGQERPASENTDSPGQGWDARKSPPVGGDKSVPVGLPEHGKLIGQRAEHEALLTGQFQAAGALEGVGPVVPADRGRAPE